MSEISPAIEAQMVRVLEAFEIAADRAERRSLARAAQPGLAADYVRRNPAACIAEIVAATGCSKTTARQAWRGVNHSIATA